MQPNILLVVLDSVRARNTSLHGHDAETTPYLATFSENQATWYEQARSPAATSLTSHASIFTGLSVPEHGLTTTASKLNQGNTIFESLQETGYETAVFSENTWITDVDVGLNQGFDTIVGPQNLPFPDALNPRKFVASSGRGEYKQYLTESLRSGAPVRSLLNGVAIKLAYDYPSLLPEFLSSSAPGDVYVEAFDEWRSDCDGPWAACVNLMDAHIPYDPKSQFDKWGGAMARSIQNDIDEQKWEFAGGKRPWWQKRALEGLYDGAIRQCDALVEEIVQRLEAAGELDDTLLVVTADHGEGFGERSHIRPETRIAEHNVAIHEVLTRVPLVVKSPGQTSSERVDELVSVQAFPRAVKSVIAGEEGRFETDEPIVSTAVGLDEPKQRRAAPYVDDLSLYTGTARAVYEQGDDTIQKFVTWRDRSRTVHVLDVDTSYVAANSDKGRVQSVYDGLRNQGISTHGEGIEEMDDETRRQLEDLGYV